ALSFIKNDDTAFSDQYSICGTTTTTQQPTIPQPTESPTSFESIPAFLRTPKPYPAQQPVELPTSLRGETVAQQPAASTLTIGERIRVMRKLLGMTQGQVAEAINVTKQAISLWESNSAVFGCDKLLPLASALNCDPLWLLGANADQVATNEAPLAPVEVMQGVDMSTIGKRIAARRIALRFSPAEMERIAGLPEGTVSLWEDGKAFPPSDAINKLAPVLHTNIHWLVTGIEIARES
ncbi:helix-turn-helix domain-containing protein, partial [Enterobacter sp. PTB]